MKKRLFVDIDGTLARFHDVDKTFIEAMWQPGFYTGLKPFENMIEGIKTFVKNNPDVEVYVLSAVLDTDPPFVVDEKNEWLDKYLPEIPSERRIFTRAGENKADYIGELGPNDYLIDDYNKNLSEFELAGGNSIKFRNDVNHQGKGAYGGEIGPLWQGNIVAYDDEPTKIAEKIDEFIFGVQRERELFISSSDNNDNRSEAISEESPRSVRGQNGPFSRDGFEELFGDVLEQEKKDGLIIVGPKKQLDEQIELANQGKSVYASQEVDLSYAEMKRLFREVEKTRSIHVEGRVVISSDSFDQEYSLDSRTYCFSSNNKAFIPNMGGYSIYASSLDGVDRMVRLEQYMAAEQGGSNGWKIERCYMLKEQFDKANRVVANHDKDVER